MIEIVILGVLVIVALVVVYVAVTEMTNFVQTRVPFVPTSKIDIQDFVQRAGITHQDIVFDLGSGNGKVLFVVENITQARTRGFQRWGWTQFYAQLRKFLTKSKAELVTGNFFDHPWSDATVIYAYLYPFLMQQVGQKALEDCGPGTKIIVRDFPIPNLKLHKVWKTPANHDMYLYIIA